MCLSNWDFMLCRRRKQAEDVPGDRSDAAINFLLLQGFQGSGEPQPLIRALNGEFLNRLNSALSQKAPDTSSPLCH